MRVFVLFKGVGMGVGGVVYKDEECVLCSFCDVFYFIHTLILRKVSG